MRDEQNLSPAVVPVVIAASLGAKVALITTEGFRDSLEIARGNRPDFFNLHYKKPVPFVPRYLRRELRGKRLRLPLRKIVGDVPEEARHADRDEQNHARVLQLESPIEQVVFQLSLSFGTHGVTHFLL